MRYFLTLTCLLFVAAAVAEEADLDFESPASRKALRDYEKVIAKDKKAIELKRKKLDEEAASLAKKNRDAFVENLKKALKQSMRAGNLEEANKIDAAIKASQKAASPAEASMAGSSDKKIEARIPKNAVKWNGHYYKLFDEPLTQGQALRFCNSLGGYLARIQNPSEQTLISGLASRGTDADYWIDGTDELIEGKWIFSNGKPIEYFAWDHGEPANAISREHHILLKNATKRWHDVAYDYRRGFICEWDGPDEKKVQAATESARQEPASQSKAKPPHPNAIKLGESYYTLFTDKVNYKTAANRCISMGGTLAVIDAEQERSGVQRLLKGTPAWVGLTRAAGTRQWIWLSGKPIKTNFPWSPGQPQYSRTELSVALWADGKFQDHHWWDRLHYVCEWKIDGNASAPRHGNKTRNNQAGAKTRRAD